jgi:S1-C subfamily serine protease
MRTLITGLIAAILISAPSFAGYSTVVQSVRAIQSWRGQDRGMGEGSLVLKNICTATSINSDKNYWLTASHCVNDVERYISGNRATVVFNDPVADLAVLYTYGYSRPSLKMRLSRPAVEQSVMMVGYPVGLPQVQVFHGRVSSLRTVLGEGAFMMFDMSACGGNSGSAIVDENDQVVSVLQIGFGEQCSPFSGGTPWETLARLVYTYFKK